MVFSSRNFKKKGKDSVPGFDSRAQQEMSCLSSDWSCGLDNLFLSQSEIAYCGIVEHCLI
uniref:Uncharacterized protein n=1 Tax=Salix viminalis TaxID=40686 RepID=A0A6N2M1Q2_SALVM